MYKIVCSNYTEMKKAPICAVRAHWWNKWSIFIWSSWEHPSIRDLLISSVFFWATVVAFCSFFYCSSPLPCPNVKNGNEMVYLEQAWYIQLFYPLHCFSIRVSRNLYCGTDHLGELIHTILHVLCLRPRLIRHDYDFACFICSYACLFQCVIEQLSPLNVEQELTSCNSLFLAYSGIHSASFIHSRISTLVFTM